LVLRLETAILKAMEDFDSESVFDYLKRKAETLGVSTVMHDVRRFIKESGKFGVTPTKRIQMSTQKRRALTKKLWIKQGGVCARIKHPVLLEDASIDHFEPLNGGGEESERNYRMTCLNHNLSKSDRSPLEESKKLGSTILDQMPRGIDSSEIS
jgi:hypothetical protein